MRRAIITIGGTVAGLAALLAFKSHPAAGAAAGTPGGTPPPTLAVGPSSADGEGSAVSASASASQATRTVTGAVANTQYGPMQVQLFVTGRRITKVTSFSRPITARRAMRSTPSPSPS